MAWLFADSFDCYAVVADAGTHWDSSSSTWALNTSGRFTGSQCLASGTAGGVSGVQLVRASGSNDATHHIVCAHMQTAALVGSSLGQYLQFLDGATGQCCIVFRSDGAILLTSGTPGGTVLATYTGAFAQNVWNGFEFEVTISAAAGVFKVRKNGNTSDDFSATGLATRPGANTYANKLQVGYNIGTSAAAARLDDLLWFSTSGAAPNTWVGDIRSCQLMPNGDASVQFSKSPTSYLMGSTVVNTTNAKLANTVYPRTYTAAQTGTISTMTFSMGAGFTGNMKVAIYAADGTSPVGGPGTVLATSAAVVNPVSGNNIFTLGTPLHVTSGTAYWFAMLTDTNCTINRANTTVATLTFSQSYGSGFPTNPTWTVGVSNVTADLMINATLVPDNFWLTSDAQQDGLTSYVYDSTVGHGDFYDLTDLPFVPVSVIGIQTRGYVEKSDAGLRQAQLQLKSGATTVQTTVLTLATSFQYTGRVDTVDPNTSSAWTAAAVNALQVGPYVTA